MLIFLNRHAKPSVATAAIPIFKPTIGHISSIYVMPQFISRLRSLLRPHICLWAQIAPYVRIDIKIACYETVIVTNAVAWMWHGATEWQTKWEGNLAAHWCIFLVNLLNFECE